MPRNPLSPRIALALGGGGARGLAHVGVLEVLEENEIPLDMIVGTSAGALVGALYAYYGNTRDVRDRLTQFTQSPQFQTQKYRDLQTMTPLDGEDRGLVQTARRVYKLGMFFATTLFKESFIDPAQFEKDMASVIPDCKIEEAPIRLAIIATDLLSGREVVITEGSARLAVRASSAIAGVFPAVLMDGEELVDGGFVNKVPVEASFRLGADVVIAVDVSTDILDSQEFARTGTAMATRAGAISAETLKNLQVRFADVLIRPDVRNVHWADFEGIGNIIPLGAEAAEAALTEVRRAIRKGYWHPWRRFLGVKRRWSVDLTEADGK